MPRFMEIKVLVGNGTQTKPITINTDMISHIEECEYEGAIIGAKSKGTAVILGNNMFATPTKYEKMAKALQFGKTNPDELLN